MEALPQALCHPGMRRKCLICLDFFNSRRLLRMFGNRQRMAGALPASAHGMSIVAPTTLVIAEMITHDYVWQGAGATCDEAKEALLTAWSRHRAGVLRVHPQLQPSLPEAAQMPQHFRIRYRAYECGGGYRGDERLV